MSSMILSISGNVKHDITIDPGVWIFDDRKVDLDTYFLQAPLNHQEEEEKKLAEAWNLHRREGTKVLSNGNDVKVSKRDLTEKSYGVPLFPFLSNSVPNKTAETVIFKTSSGKDFSCSLQEANESILGFSKKGQPLKEDGPVHFYFGDGSNKGRPITHIVNIIVE